MTYLTYTIRVSSGSDAQDLVDALNAPRNPEDDTVDPGLGPSTCPDDATELLALTQATAQPDDTAQERQITLSVPPRDVERFESIISGVSSAEAKRWHPEGKAGSAHDSAPPFRSPSEHPPDGLERIPSDSEML